MNTPPLFARRSAPAVRTLADKVVTSTGIVIGAAYERPAHSLGAHAEAIQTALLAPRRRAAAWVRAVISVSLWIGMTRLGRGESWHGPAWRARARQGRARLLAAMNSTKGGPSV